MNITDNKNENIYIINDILFITKLFRLLANKFDSILQ